MQNLESERLAELLENANKALKWSVEIIAARDISIKELKEHIEILLDENKVKNKNMAFLQGRFDEKNKEIKGLSAENSKLNQDIVILNLEINNLRAEISQLKARNQQNREI